jgi:hypothetical protein
VHKFTEDTVADITSQGKLPAGLRGRLPQAGHFLEFTVHAPEKAWREAL